jgi:hypothetical protein
MQPQAGAIPFQCALSRKSTEAAGNRIDEINNQHLRGWDFDARFGARADGGKSCG